MSAAEGRVLVREEDGAWHVTLSNPAKRNAITWPMYDELEKVCLRARQDPGLRVLILRGGGGAAFAAGTDISQFTGFDGDRGVDYENHVGRVLTALLEVPAPVVAVVEGPAVGAGLAVAACSDIVLAAPDAVFGAPIARTLGNCLPPLVVERLCSRLGVGPAMAMLLTATLVPAERARELGLVFEVVDPTELDARAAALTARIAAGAPLTLSSVKEIGRRLDAATPRVDADDLLRRCYGSADFREGVAAFLDHRRPEWKGR